MLRTCLSRVAPASRSTFVRAASTKASQILVNTEDRVRYIRVNRPETKNAFSVQVFEELTEQFNAANDTKDVSMVIYSGVGEFFTSGNDQHNFKLWMGKNEKEAKEGVDYFMARVQALIASFINLRKPLLIAANGPGVGVGCTSLGLSDYAVCSDNSWFWAPFSMLGVNAEFCSSLTFPELIGRSRASQVLMMNHKITSKEALDWGLVSKVFPKSDFESSLKELIHGKQGILQSCSMDAMLATKSIMVNDERRKRLHEINRLESELLGQRLLSKEAIGVAEKFLSKSK